MSSRIFLLYAAIPLLLIGLSACSSTRSTIVEDPTASTADSDEAIESLYWARQDSAKMRYTQANVDFMTGMIGHHAQALVMSAFAPDNGASPSIQTLAARIINAQNDEIASMQQWLRDRNEAVPEVHISGSKLMIHGAGEHHMHMPGMLTDQQLSELEAARGLEFDRLFLTFMIQHHKGAVTMVDDLFEQDGAGMDEQNFKIASDIHVDQITEIARMEKMLNALPEAQ
ncbi:MAG: DUF305 domain-containing protein [Rhodothermales bacterium]|nr:DUF305 domain-containing protein [Rhodothermales bacterium]